MNETAKYKITGLVDKFDEQGVIVGQYPIGSIQELPTEVGTQAVAEGRAEAVAADEEVRENSGNAEATHTNQNTDNVTVDPGKIKSYKVTGEIFPTDEHGTPLDTPLEIDSIVEVPETVGKTWVESGVAEEVQ